MGTITSQTGAADQAISALSPRNRVAFELIKAGLAGGSIKLPSSSSQVGTRGSEDGRYLASLFNSLAKSLD